MQIKLRLTGTRPMIQHNGRLSNPFDPHTRALAALTSKKKKTDEDLFAIMRTEARGGAYETDDNELGLPTGNVWRAIYDAATAHRLGADVKRALLFEDTTPPLLVSGETVDVDEYLSDPVNIDYRPVVLNRKRVMRARPIVREWSCEHEFELLEDVIDPRQLAPVLQRAGRLGGMCEWRPTYGRFEVEVL